MKEKKIKLFIFLIFMFFMFNNNVMAFDQLTCTYDVNDLGKDFEITIVYESEDKTSVSFNSKTDNEVLVSYTATKGKDYSHNVDTESIPGIFGFGLENAIVKAHEKCEANIYLNRTSAGYMTVKKKQENNDDIIGKQLVLNEEKSFSKGKDGSKKPSKTTDDDDPIVISFAKCASDRCFSFQETKSGKRRWGYYEDDPKKASYTAYFSGNTIYGTQIVEKGTTYTYIFDYKEIDEFFDPNNNKEIYSCENGFGNRLLTYDTTKNSACSVLTKSKHVEINLGHDDIGGTYKALSTICDASDSANDKVFKVLKFIGYLLFVVKILVPLGLIAFGAKDLINVVISGNMDELAKFTKSFGYKIVAAIVLFLLPTIVNFTIGLISNAEDGTSPYEDCRTCIFDPNECPK